MRHWVNMDRYGISKNHLRELHYFCRQYDEKVREASKMVGPKAGKASGGRRKGTQGSPTEYSAIRREQLLQDVELIDRAARETDGGRWAQALIESCCRGTQLQHMDIAILPTSNRNDFYRARREFYWRLDKLKNKSTD